MTGNLLMLAVVLLWGVWGIANKYAAVRVSPVTAQWMYALPYLLLLPVWMGLSLRAGPWRELDKAGLGWALLASLASILALLVLYMAIRLRPASIVLSLTSTYPLVVLAFGLLTRTEQVTPGKLAGIVLIGLGVALIQVGG